MDTTSAYFSYLDNIYFTKNQYSSDIYKIKIKKLTFVQRGIVGEKNDIIVDDVKMPKKIFGVCDGKGNLINYNFVQKKKLIKKVFSIVKKKLSYD